MLEIKVDKIQIVISFLSVNERRECKLWLKVFWIQLIILKG
jgi:hypothetical protein